MLIEVIFLILFIVVLGSGSGSIGPGAKDHAKIAYWKLVSYHENPIHYNLYVKISI